jgi:hypothetical protein
MRTEFSTVRGVDGRDVTVLTADRIRGSLMQTLHPGMQALLVPLVVSTGCRRLRTRMRGCGTVFVQAPGPLCQLAASVIEAASIETFT